MDVNKYRNLKRRFRQETKGFEHIIVSSEEFQNCKKMENVTDFFSGFNLHVIIYYREILDYLQSAYAQRVQNTNEIRNFEQFALTTRLSYEGFYRRWQSVADKVSVGYFHRAALKNADIVDDFFAKIGIDNQTLAPITSDSNPSIGGNLLYFKLRLNQLGIESNRAIYHQLSTVAEANPARFATGFAIKDELAHKIRHQYAHNNEFLMQYCGNGISYRSYEDKPPCPDIHMLKEDFQTILEQWSACDIRLEKLLGSH